MAHINDNYQKLPGSYLFSEIARRVNAYAEANPAADIIRLGIGDVTQPIAPTIVCAVKKAADEMGTPEGFHGYAPDLGYAFLREAIRDRVYAPLGVHIETDEIFISDGAKSDSSAIQELFAADSLVAVCDPVYPVYVDSNALAGRLGTFDAGTGRWSRLIYLPCTADNSFVPALPEETPDLIYLCMPNNPTGTTLTVSQLQTFVDYASEHDCVILYDAAYEAYITEPDVPRSIYVCPGAETCAIELRSFSKNAGFTGMRLGYTVVPKALKRDGASLRDMWARRHGTKFNGAPYIIQRAGEAAFSKEGQKELDAQVAFYIENARIIREGLSEAGFEVYGGVNAPYIWMRTPGGMTSWDFFDRLLESVQIVGTPGSGFGPSGEGYFRLTAFGTRENSLRAIERVRRMN